ncbi:hypothetical protein D9613_008791 [Agrocybe pediades]|uniref:Amidohydrolase-related domain-containing protein n=1 Tax=Agrocybe pediades TaxID=84607 RepID=A0A8H4QTL3_9AGAR|nr:hypothetical protein D9613_008791 [Agrocybe pediades]
MKTSTLFSIFAAVALSKFSVVVAQEESNITATILSNAAADDIDLSVLEILPEAFAEIEEVYVNGTLEESTASKRSLGRFARRATPNNIVDSHAHVSPAWYKALYPEIGGAEVPDWTMQDQLAFMEGQGIQRAIFSFSTPGPLVWPSSKVLTVALARLLNEQAAAYCRAYPGRFSFYAQVPLPYTTETIHEAKYAIEKLGAVGIWVQSNIDGKYLGDASFKPFFQTVNSWAGRQIIYIHPAVPVLKIRNQVYDANPTPYIAGKIEFYFETARTLMDLTLTETIHNFTNIHYVIPHLGGAFPSTVDRILKSYPTIYNSSFEIFSTRFWWDSAGPTFFHQVSGLLGIGVPSSQILYGTDFPYALSRPKRDPWPP